jgi:cysteinyl-tRNA synthetase
MVFVRDALRQFDANAIRLYLLSHHYREPWEYEDDGPARFQPLVERLRDALARTGGAETPRFDPAAFADEFDRALERDLDTPAAIVALDRLTNAIADSPENDDLHDAQQTLRALSETLGLISR